jgi:hypothetical protein
MYSVQAQKLCEEMYYAYLFYRNLYENCLIFLEYSPHFLNDYFFNEESVPFLCWRIANIDEYSVDV